MLAFILRRLLQAIVVMLTVAFIAFMLFQYVGDPVTYLLGYLSNPTSDEYYRIRIEIFCIIFGVCVKLYTHTGFKFSSEKFCIQNNRKIRLYKTPKKDYVSIMPIKAKSIFNWSQNPSWCLLNDWDLIFG